MNLRTRLGALVLGVASMVGVLAVLPAASQAGTSTKSAPSSPRCQEARELAIADGKLILQSSPTFSRQQAKAYAALVVKFVADACDTRKKCKDLRDDVNAMRAFRAGKISSSTDATITADEDAFLGKYCASA